MSTYTTLALFKLHSRTDDFDTEDAILQKNLNAAEAHVIRATGRTGEELVEMGGGTFPEDLEQAIYALADHFYEHKSPVEMQSSHAMPYSIGALIRPYRKLTTSE